MSKRMLFILLSTLMVLALVMAACSGDEETESEDISGQTVNILTAAGEDQIAAFEASLAPFEERTGVDVVVEGSGDFETLAVVRAEADDPPDIYNFPQPGLMADFARDDFLIDLGQFLEDDYMKEQYNQTWIDLGTVDGTLYGVWHNADVKSLVWYPKDDFEAAGYEIPETWDELVALTDQIVADGHTPWCIAVGRGGAAGGVGGGCVTGVILCTARCQTS